MNAHSEGHNAFDNTICPRCGKPKPDVEERWSSGVYVGKFCAECWRSDRDNCEIDQGPGIQLGPSVVKKQCSATMPSISGSFDLRDDG